MNSANRMILFGNRNADFDELLHNSKGSIDVIEHLKLKRPILCFSKERKLCMKIHDHDGHLGVFWWDGFFEMCFVTCVTFYDMS